MVLKLDPKNTEAWNYKGFSLYLLKNYKDAIPCFNKALELDPSYEDAINNRLVTLMAMSRVKSEK
jgi:lipoprotein NlpI